ncbi:MAG: hypothetical protein ACREBG_29075 [Pyrinomonadaceae bacterium]
MKHFFYSARWKKFERAWDIRIKQLSHIRPLLEAVLAPVDTSVAPVTPVADLPPQWLPKKPMELTREAKDLPDGTTVTLLARQLDK